jgi:hypothetical protein
MEEEQWDENATATIVGTCDRCHETRPLQQVIDPFVSEGIVDGELDKEWWCYPCFSRRADDV